MAMTMTDGRDSNETQLPWAAGLRGEVAELALFTWKNAISCAFPAFIFLCLGLTHTFSIPGVHRYDLLLALCLTFQAVMVLTKLETRDELLVICLFHALGLAMEILKVSHGSWSYPGPALTKVLGVPLFSGFMYASVASFICQAWRRFGLVWTGWPPRRIALGVGIYLNFIANLFVPDFRSVLFVLIGFAFSGVHVEYTPHRSRRRMPAIVAFFLVGLFIWFAENIATFLGAWRYPNQHHGWNPVYLQKLSSWFLLVIVSLMIVAELKRLKDRR